MFNFIVTPLRKIYKWAVANPLQAIGTVAVAVAAVVAGNAILRNGSQGKALDIVPASEPPLIGPQFQKLSTCVVMSPESAHIASCTLPSVYNGPLVCYPFSGKLPTSLERHRVTDTVDFAGTPLALTIADSHKLVGSTRIAGIPTKAPSLTSVTSSNGKQSCITTIPPTSILPLTSISLVCSDNDTIEYSEEEDAPECVNLGPTGTARILKAATENEGQTPPRATP